VDAGQSFIDMQDQIAMLVLIVNQRGESEVDGVKYHKDQVLLQRWQCSPMKLWRMRKAGKLNSIQIGGCGPHLTSDAEIARIEAPPDIAKPRPCASTQEAGPTAENDIKPPRHSEPAAPAQASSNGGGA
jgi:hypothetical protein